jgi:hypothetical protein
MKSTSIYFHGPNLRDSLAMPNDARPRTVDESAHFLAVEF